MSTNPGIAVEQEPISAEVTRMDDQQRNALDELRARLHEKAIDLAGRAQGVAALAEQKATQVSERVVALEDHERDIRADIKIMMAKLDGVAGKVDAINKQSPVQQALYSLTALAFLSYILVLLYRTAMGAG